MQFLPGDGDIRPHHGQRQRDHAGDRQPRGISFFAQDFGFDHPDAQADGDQDEDEPNDE
ncbi:MAG: hypothetical protein QM811_11090 [Pirellulales bacterium]